MITRERLESLPTRTLRKFVHDGQATDDELEMAQEIIDGRGYSELGYGDPNFTAFERDTVAVMSSTANYVLTDAE